MKKLCLLFTLTLQLILIVTTYSAGKTKHSKSFHDLSLDNFHISIATPPNVTTSGATEIQPTSVKFNSSINPNGTATNAWFDWGLTSSFGNSTSPQNVGSGSIFVPFSQTDSGLTPNTIYHYRAVAQNSFGITNGNERTVTTLAIPPTVTTLSVSNVGVSSATIYGSANPNNAATNGYFEWGADTSYGNTTTAQSLGSGTNAVNFNQVLTGLLSNTTYHYRAVGLNSAGTARGSDQIFATLVSSNEYQPDTNTIALYHFNESSGMFVRDYSGHELHGTANNENIGDGRYGNARHYDLSSDIIVVNNNPLFNAATNELTVEAWVSPLLGGIGDLYIASRGHPDSSNFSYALIARASRQLEFILNDSVGGKYSVLSTDSPLTDGAWHHVAAVVKCQTSSIKLYHNGGELTTIPSGTFTHSIVPAGSFSVGLPYSGPSMNPKIAFHQREAQRLFHCGIDEVRISKIARQPADFNVYGIIQGTKFHDLNSNGARDVGEPGLNDWTIILSGAASETTHTDISGDYSFSNLPPGTYTVSESTKSGWVQTLPPSSGNYTVTMDAGLDTNGFDFGNFAPSINVNKGWNMISIPVTVSDSSVSSQFPNAISNAFTYNTSGYVVPAKLQNRLGYWLKFSNNEIIPVLGSPRTLDTLIAPTSDSWYLVGSITNPIPVSQITTDPPGMPVLPFFGYNGSYFIADTIKPGKGYWAKNFTRLILSSSSASPKSFHNILTELSSLNTLTITDANRHAQTLYFGTAGKELSPSLYELPPIPPVELFDVRFASQRFVEQVRSGEPTETKILTQGLIFPVTISWRISDERAQFTLFDETGFNHKLASNGSTIVERISSTLALRMNGEGELSLPKGFALHQNYPNPFNPSTLIRYEIPASSYVTLKVYNLLGQHVATLVDEMQSAGFREIEFNALSLPSGVYTYLLTAGDFRDVKSMVIVK